MIFRLITVIKNIVISIYSNILSNYYSPKKIINKNKYDEYKLSFIDLDNYKYAIAEIENGRIYTNRISNISIMKYNNLIPHVSWQYQDGIVVSDSENYLLNRKIQINSLPKKVSGVLISIVTGGGGNYNYYHWLFDCLPRIYLIQKFISPEGNIKYFIPEDTLNFQKETLNALGLTDSHRISSKKFQHVKSNKLIVTSHPNPDPSKIPNWIYNFLRDSFIMKTISKAEQFIYISRDDGTNSRRLLNEERLVAALESKGFKKYNLSNMSFTNQVTLFSEAKIVVGVHGAGLANLVFAPKGTIVFELFSNKYQPNIFESISILGDLNYNKIVCEADNTELKPQKSNLIISDIEMDRIMKHVKLIIGNADADI